MRIITPMPNSSYTITAAAEWPSIPFQTDATGQHTWNWALVWGRYKQSGSASTPSNQWDAKSVVTNLGGTLTVRVQAGQQIAILVVKIKGTNPSAADVTGFLASKPNSSGFDRILIKESGCRNFNITGEPVVSFDQGYGICQLTNPAPTFEQAWNWKSNVEAGLKLFAGKQIEAISYLSQGNRSYTADQLKYETVCRWNGGTYHEWDATAGAWVRHPNIVCDSATGNIGWDMSDPQNSGKTEAALHKRASASYGAKPSPSAHWEYSGVCYADKLLG